MIGYVEPSIICNGSPSGGFSASSWVILNVGMVDVRVLGLGVVAPDNDVVDFIHIDIETVSDLTLGPKREHVGIFKNWVRMA